MNLARLAVPVLLLAAAAFAQPKSLPVMPYDSLMFDRVSVDGYVDPEDDEYPAFFHDKPTGITVHWGFDDEHVYIALEAKGTGWLAIGLGSPKMNESNMMIGYYTDDSSDVTNHRGAGYGHAEVAADTNAIDFDADIDFDDETGVTTLEFSYPLDWRGARGLAVPGLVPGDVYDFILARNPKSPSLAAKHGSKSALKFAMAAKPEPPPGK